MVPGQLLTTTISTPIGSSRVVQLSLDSTALARAQVTEVSEVGSLVPGHLVLALITAVIPSGLNVKICGFYDGTIDLAHLDLKGSDIDEKYKIGKKVLSSISSRPC